MSTTIIKAARLKRNTEASGAETTVTGWQTFGRGYVTAEIDQIEDVAGASSERNITSVPSPLAQMHIFDDAFKYVFSNKNHPSRGQNTIYHKLVSHCLDVWEILFTYNQHAGLDFKYWNKAAAILALQNAPDPAHKLLGNTLDLYFNRDINPRIQAIDGIYLITYNGQVFAGTSPFTGFFVTPNEIDIPLTNSNNLPFFQIDKPLHQRRREFQYFIARFLRAFQPQAVFLFRNFYEYAIDCLQNQSAYKAELTRLFGAVYTPDSFNTDYPAAITSTGGANMNFLYNYGANTLQFSMPAFTIQVDDSCELIIKPTKPYTIGQTQLPLVLKTNIGGTYLGGQPLNHGYLIPLDVADEYGNSTPLNQRLLPVHNIKHPYITAGDFIEEYLIELDYSINDEAFHTGQTIDFGDGFKYLLPIKPLYFQYFSHEDLNRNLMIEKSTFYIKVSINVPLSGGRSVILERTFKKFDSYTPTCQQIRRPDETQGGTAGTGAIISARFGLSLYPLLKVQPTDGVPSQFNDFYKIGVGYLEGFSNVVLNNVLFFKEHSDAGAVADPLQVVPSVDKTTFKESGGSAYSYYILGSSGINCEFDYLQLEFDNQGINTIKALIYPKWLRPAVGATPFEVAVDFGTSNSYVAYRQGGGIPRSFDISAGDKQLVRLDKPSAKPGLSPTQKYENNIGYGGTVTTSLLTEGQRQFDVPSVMGIPSDGHGYKMPFTTAVSCERDAATALKINHATANIPFALSKYDQKGELVNVFTNIKWSDIQPGSSEEKRIEVFMKQLLYMIRNKILLNGGNPSTTTFRWFKPVSMSFFQSGQFTNLWSNLLTQTFHTALAPMMITESEAPYYIHDAQGNLDGNNPVLSIDIGGGTTDVLVFHRGQPLYANSSFMASRVMFGEFRAIAPTKNNPILRFYKGKIADKIDQFISSGIVENREVGNEMKKIHERYWNDGTNARSEDIIGFYFSRHELQFADILSHPSSPFKISFLLYFAAIHYDCASFLKSQGLGVPRHICMSGNGSKMISIIDAAAAAPNSPFAKFISEIYRKVMEVEFTHTITIHTTPNPKEATAQGGLYKDKNFKNAYAEIRVHAGEKLYDNNGNIVENGIKYGDLRNERLIFKAEDSNYLELIDLFTGHLNDLFNYNEYFGIQCNLREIERLLTDPNTIEADYTSGIAKRLQMSGDDENLAETVFFYAVAGAIERLSKYMAQHAVKI